LDFLAHPFWDKYLEFEDRLEAHDKIFAILDRVVKIPMHQYARYFERFRQMAHTRPLQELLPAETLAQYRAEVEAENATFQAGPKGELEIEREIRTKIDNFHLEIFTRTQTETTKRWTYESEIKRPYFHVTELDHAQLANWRKYLDFEEAEGDYTRAVFLYERCLVTCAFYDEFWFRYARWMSAQPGKQEEVRNIYQRASTIYVPISRPGIRLQYAYFEEMSERVDVARDIHQAILDRMPGHVETVVSWANLERRQSGLPAAIEVYKAQIDNPAVDIFAKAAYVVEWAFLLWRIQGSVDEARQVFQKNQQWYLQSRHFWVKYLEFELAQPTSSEKEAEHYATIKQIYNDMIQKSRMSLATKRDISNYYLSYLQQRGTKGAMKEFLQIDKELNG
jgi:pre-mRNA-processing factor 39